MAVAEIDPRLGAHCLALAENAISNGNKDTLFYCRVTTLPLVARLPDGTAQAEKLFTEQLSLANTSINQDYLELLATKMAPINPALAEQAWAKLKGDKLSYTLSEMIKELAPTNLPEAQRLLQKLLAMQTPYLQETALRCVVNELGKTDPAAALALAQTPIMTSYAPSSNGKLLPDPQLLVAASAFQPKEKALQLCRDIVQSADTLHGGNLRAIIDAAALAWSLDLATGRALFTQVGQYPEIEKGIAQNSYDYFAAPANPVECRINVESDFAATQQHGGWDHNSIALIILTLSMAQLDRDRALALAADLPAAEYANSWDFNGFLDYLLADEQQRRTDFLHW